MIAMAPLSHFPVNTYINCVLLLLHGIPRIAPPKEIRALLRLHWNNKIKISRSLKLGQILDHCIHLKMVHGI